MKKEKTESLRTGVRSFRLFLCSAFFCVLAAFSVLGEEPAELTMSVGYGYRNMAKTGQLLPVTVSFVNRTGEDVQGFLSLEVPGKETSVSYTQAVTVPAGESAVRSTVTIPDTEEAEQEDMLLARFFDDSGDQILAAATVVSYLGTGREVFCGVLSDDPSGLGYLGNASLGTDLNTRVITLNPADMPEEEDGLSQLDIIVISGFDAKRLSAQAVHAIISWVSTGGTLIFGTGNSTTALGTFGELIGNPEFRYSGIREVDMGMQYSSSGPDGAVIRVPVQTVTWESSEAIQESGEYDLILRRSFGKGSICIASYDFRDISAFCGEHPEFTEDFLAAAVGQAGLSRLQDSLLSGAQRLSAGEELTNTYEETAVPGISVYLVLGVLFVLLAGAGLFRLLSSRGLSLYYLLGVLILSMVFSLLLWFYSGKTRITEPFIDYGEIREYFVQGDMVQVESQGFIRMQSPLVNAVTLELPSDCTVRPIRTVGQISITSGKTQMIAITGQKQFESSSFLVEQSSMEETDGLPLKAELYLGTEGLGGCVENCGSRVIEGLCLVYRGQFQYLGQLDAGQSLNISGTDSLFGPVSKAELVSSQIAGKYPELSYRLQKESLLTYCLQESVAIEEGRALILGFPRGMEPQLLEQNGYSRNGSVLISLAVDVSNAPEEELQFSYISSPQVVSGSYDPVTGCVRGSATTVLEYSLGSGQRIENLKLTGLSEELEGDLVAPFRGQMALYNYKNAAYDLVDAGKDSWTEEELTEYLSPTNNLTVRYIPDGQAGDTVDIWLPLLCAAGRDRDRIPETEVSSAGNTGPKDSGKTTSQAGKTGTAPVTDETVLNGPVPEPETINSRTPGER